MTLARVTVMATITTPIMAFSCSLCILSAIHGLKAPVGGEE
jgi:hypothetical protein